jgi:hypothetical protein
MKNLIANIGWPLTILVVVLFVLTGVILGLYFLNFNYGFAKDQAVWGTFGDFVGGVLNPVLSFSTILILVFSTASEKSKARQEREKHESEQRLSISLAYQDRMAHLLEKIGDEIDPLIKMYPAPPPLDRKNQGSVFFRIAKKLSLMAHFIAEIEKLDPNSPILQYYVRQYKSTIADYSNLGYVNANTHIIFHKQRENESKFFFEG